MEITITKRQEVVNDEAQPEKYDVHVKRHYGTGDLKWSKDDWLSQFDLQDMTELAQKLSDKFLNKNP